ncbi:RNA polymerase sigma-70 factor [[Actinomadura] parvosata subsp. kistnae]|uniref:RNA polymerase sigma factor n=1 Tax=[Actinomadura] parvosata subsp. kistnae TaxID=1909395 RepID=A0A1V0A1B6_9ACTN|nr:sigma-70 family RNA polymerase sigma factor [Nonomuraea sp. ATCC 55076]AQZ64005.1 RNA polymerase subunit sigma-70 [Nonomuraea sp. ATCC 55076]SPL89881.1 RNA polymerase sigma-70 factor [Actinomadura parvosata subsp. kistnae]
MRGIPPSDETGADQTGAAGRLLTAARGGDGDAFRALVEPYRRELHVHCYRLLGSVQDAEDLVQETLLAAWRGIGGYEERASLRTWLYRIATNRCLNALRAGARRPAAHAMARVPPSEHAGASVPASEPVPTPMPAARPARQGEEASWLEPYPDVLLDELPDRLPGPEARYETSESVSLAFLAALQRLPARQRAVLVLRDVLGYRAAEVADLLGTTTNAVTMALKRARATLSRELPGPGRESAPLPGSPRERRLVAGFTRAFEAGDVDAIVALLTQDASLTMPPLPLAFRGPDEIRTFLATAALAGGRRYALIPTRANGQPAFGCYLRDPRTPILHAQGVLVLTLAGERVCALTRFHDNSLLTAFGLPRSLRA